MLSGISVLARIHRPIRTGVGTNPGSAIPNRLLFGGSVVGGRAWVRTGRSVCARLLTSRLRRLTRRWRGTRWRHLAARRSDSPRGNRVGECDLVRLGNPRKLRGGRAAANCIWVRGLCESAKGSLDLTRGWLRRSAEYAPRLLSAHLRRWHGLRSLEGRERLSGSYRSEWRAPSRIGKVHRSMRIE